MQSTQRLTSESDSTRLYTHTRAEIRNQDSLREMRGERSSRHLLNLKHVAQEKCHMHTRDYEYGTFLARKRSLKTSE